MKKAPRRTTQLLKSHRLRTCIVMLSLVTLAAPANICAQEDSEGWSVGTLDISGLKWGKQTRRIRIANNSDDYRFLAVECETRSVKAGFVNPRVTRSNYIIFPGQEGEVSVTIDVPESFSKVIVKFGLYDVIDTLDDLALGEKLYGIEETVDVEFPETLKPYMSLRLRPGGALRYNETLSDDLQLAINLLLIQGKSVNTISEIVGLPTEYVNHLIRLLTEEGLVTAPGGWTRSALIAIENLPFSRLDSLVNTTATKMTESLRNSVTDYRQLHSDLIAAGKVAPYADQVVEGTGILHHLYPVICGIVLWERLGSKFLGSPDGPVQLMRQSSPCEYMADGYGYILADPAAKDGRGYFHFDTLRQRKIFGLGGGKLACYEPPAGSRSPNYKVVAGKRPILYLVDEARADTPLNVLTKPLEPLRDNFDSALTGIFNRSGAKLTNAHRLWLWNRLTTQIIDSLIKAGVIEDHNLNYFTWKSDE